jgi:iron complex transport system substrate-binding protein
MVLVKKLLSMTENNTEQDKPRSLAAVWQGLRRTDMPEVDQLALRRRLLSLQIRTAAVDRQRLLIVESMAPLRAAGFWMPELAELVGADLVISRKGEAPVEFTMEDVAQAEPNLIIVACSGKSLAQNSLAAQALAEVDIPIFAASADRFFWLPNAQLVETAEILAEILHQDARLHFGHEGTHWQAVSTHSA